VAEGGVVRAKEGDAESEDVGEERAVAAGGVVRAKEGADSPGSKAAVKAEQAVVAAGGVAAQGGAGQNK